MIRLFTSLGQILPAVKLYLPRTLLACKIARSVSCGLWFWTKLESECGICMPANSLCGTNNGMWNHSKESKLGFQLQGWIRGAPWAQCRAPLRTFGPDVDSGNTTTYVQIMIRFTSLGQIILPLWSYICHVSLLYLYVSYIVSILHIHKS